ncbi:MAG: ribosome-associated translation inhibitor RaiA [Yaniella sp.]|uniref:ribosome hibernation-promoting factor, HPF/YfiA family n=1 Tax=Yaniella sp. TaxID=2773929 RepID=UPI00184E57A7|nr:ribosome-associated translation inhibitor RaiA [Yaniella sp.]NLZ97614.1 ribosome-associated translation inhibitor RaiA [Micrococcus sp.]MDN5730864.1 ribosome-associated translation inhibitor RaiA [Yaniella sp.]MDN5815496.1 ribosome-associated translation inhibitor RaiA [Yaniella sp.]MDN5817554.1 ribosome-associated translation inhibitor RaiA [Yaniella sp.]MDN5837798.1 ribosome-associated translation inhibitor RaiA [Yaniella sp.]
MALDINYLARDTDLSDDFRTYVEEKFEKISSLTEQAQRLEVKLVSRESHTGASGLVTAELTLHSPRNVVRSEANDNDKQIAFDHAFARLQERLRRLRERAKSGRRRPSVQELTQNFAPVPSDVSLVEEVLEQQAVEAQEQAEQERLEQNGDIPVTIRRKVFPTQQMTLDDAIDNMELVGHDFYLFIDEESGLPSVAYRRRGWSYGVIAMGEEESETVRDYRQAEA